MSWLCRFGEVCAAARRSWTQPNRRLSVAPMMDCADNIYVSVAYRYMVQRCISPQGDSVKRMANAGLARVYAAIWCPFDLMAMHQGDPVVLAQIAVTVGFNKKAIYGCLNGVPASHRAFAGSPDVPQLLGWSFVAEVGVTHGHG